MILMKEREIYEKTQLLKAGQVVEIDGNFFRAVNLGVIGAFSPCCDCDLDSLCTGNVAYICDNLDFFKGDRWMLKLANRTQK